VGPEKEPTRFRIKELATGVEIRGKIKLGVGEEKSKTWRSKIKGEFKNSQEREAEVGTGAEGKLRSGSARAREGFARTCVGNMWGGEKGVQNPCRVKRRVAPQRG